MENKPKNQLLFERINLIGFAVIGSFFMVLRLMGKKEILGVEIEYSSILNLLLLSIITHFITLSFKTQSDSKEIIARIDDIQSMVIQSIRGVEKRNFLNITELDSYVAKRIKDAKFSVLDLNWQDFREMPKSHYQINRNFTDNEIDKSIESFCKRKRKSEEKNKTIYEEIFTFPETNKENLEKMKKRIEYGEFYSCYYYETNNLKPILKFPKLQFVIVDNEEVIFASSEYNGDLCAIKDKKLVNICLNYFMQARTLSTIIKDKNKAADRTLIDEIEVKYK